MALTKIALCGSISLETAGVLVEESRLGGARARLAFALLVLERHRPVERDQLAEALWPDVLPTTWESAVRGVVSTVRAFLGAAGLPATELLTSKFGCYQLSLPADTIVDVEAAATAVDAAETALAAGSAARALPEASLARAITGRPFLPGAHGEWVEAVRRRLAGLRVRALDAASRAAIGSGDLTAAIAAANDLVAVEPYREPSHVLLMEAHLAAGNRGEAIRVYGRARHLLAEELGVDPSTETEALYRSLLNEEQATAPPEHAVVWRPTAADGPPNNLPILLSSFVGRDREMRELGKLLEADRLVTLTGPAGSGKTRLALELATRTLASHPDGSWFVDLATISDPGLVAHIVAGAVGVAEQPPRPVVDSLGDHFRSRECILVIDNCEHLLEPCAALVESLLRYCPLLWVLATSREPLGVPGEMVWRVPPLSTPEPGGHPSIEALMGYEAPRLFVDRARALVTDHSFVEADAPALAQICRALDGIPLAIELAAACTPMLSVRQIAARLDDRFHLLTHGSRTAQVRHQTLLAAVGWSHELLTPAQKILLRRLSVLAGSWTLDAAEEVCAGPDLHPANVFALLRSLVDKSLVVSQTSGSQARYSFLETMRLFAHDRLVESGEAEAFRDAHLAWCASLAVQAEEELVGADQQAWFERLDNELDNIRAALEWACTTSRSDLALPMASALTLYWHVRGHYAEGRQWFEEVLALDPGAAVLARSKALWGLGVVTFYGGDVAAAVPVIVESSRLAEEAGWTQGVARALGLLGELASFQDPSSAGTTLEQSVALARQAADRWCLSYSLASRACAELYRGDGPRGRPFAEESLEVARLTGDARNVLRGSLCLAWAAFFEGFFEDGGDAEVSIDLGLRLARQLGDLGWTGLLLAGQGELSWRRGDYGRARLLLDESLEIGRQLGSPLAIALPAGLLGRLAKAKGDLDDAAERFEVALDVVRKAGMDVFVPWWLWGRADVYRLSGDLGPAVAGLAEARGLAERLGNEHVVAYTLWASARIASSKGHYDKAEDFDLEALRRRRDVGDGAGILDSLDALAGLAAIQGDADRATRLLAAADAHRTRRRCPRPVPMAADHEAEQALAWSRLAADAFDRAWAEGSALPLAEAVTLALAAGGGRPSGDAQG